MKYIDAEKLIAEIERLEALYDKALKNPSFVSYESGLIAKGKHRQREDLLSFITSLQQEQPVDLEKAATEEELKKAMEERYPMPENADALTRDKIAAARNGFLSGYSWELSRK